MPLRCMKDVSILLLELKAHACSVSSISPRFVRGCMDCGHPLGVLTWTIAFAEGSFWYSWRDNTYQSYPVAIEFVPACKFVWKMRKHVHRYAMLHNPSKFLHYRKEFLFEDR
jgi:hypothetical protein